MELSETLAKLPDELVDEWKARIFDDTSLIDPTVSALAEEIAKRVDPSAESVRQPLSDLLNGHTREVFRWLADEPTDKAAALCDSMVDGVTPKTLLNVYLSLMPRLGGRTLGPEALEHLDLQVEVPDDSNLLEPLEAWFGEQGRPDDIEDTCLPWSQFSDHLKAIYEHLATLDSPPRLLLSAGLSGRRRRRLPDKSELVVELGRDRLRDFGRDKQLIVGPDSDSDVELEIPFRRMEQSDLNGWLEKLEDLAVISSLQASRARDFLESVPIDRLSELSESHLLYVLEDATEDRRPYSPTVFQRRRTEWLRGDLRNDAEPTAERWLRNTSGVFERWIKTTGTLRGTATRDQLDQILGVTAAQTDDVDRESLVRGIEDSLRADSREDLETLKGKLVTLLPDKLKISLEESQLIRSAGGNRYELAPQLRSLAEWEMPLHLRPHDLADIDVRANQELLSEAVRLAPEERLGEWCNAALDVEGLDQPETMSVVLRGLTRRTGPSEKLPEEPLVRLWASHLWATVFRLHSYVDGGLNPTERTTARQASEELRSALPVLDDPEGPAAALEPLVDDKIQESVDRWLNSATPDIEDNVDEQLAELDSFQIPVAEARRHNPDQIWPFRLFTGTTSPALHLAEQGDKEARYLVLTDRATTNFRERLSLEKRLTWWRDVASGVDLEESGRFSFRKDIEEALDAYSKEPDDRLREELAEAIQHEQLGDLLPDEVDRAVTAIQAGPIDALQWLLEPLRDKPNRTDYLLDLADILNAKGFLRSLISIDVSELPDPTRMQLCKGSLSHDENSAQRPKLSFPSLRKLAEFRHRAIIRLARLGDPGPLRDSLDRRWKVRADRVGQESKLFRSLTRAVDPYRQHSNQPAIDDETWRDVLEVIACQSLKDLRDSVLSQTNWSPPSASTDAPKPDYVQLLAIESTPAGERWPQLAPFVESLWPRRRRSWERLKHLWELLQDDVVVKEGDDIWKAPPDLAHQRKEWALRHDEETLEKWCKESFSAGELVDNLDGLAESAWPHLMPDQQRELLDRLPEGQLPDQWWSRGQDLPLTEPLNFARKHGSLKDRRRVARHLLQASPTDKPKKRVATWLDLHPDERPPDEELTEPLNKLEESLDPNDLEDKKWARVLVETQDPERVAEWLPVIFKEIFCADLEEKASGEATFEELPDNIDRLLHRFDEAFRAMGDTQLQHLFDGIQRLKDKLYKRTVRTFPDANSTVRHRIADRLAKVRSRIQSAAEPSGASDIESYEDAIPELERLGRDAEDNSRLDVEQLFHRLNTDDRTRLLKDASSTPGLMNIEGALGTLLFQIDRSDMPSEEAHKTTAELLQSATDRLEGLAEDKETARERRLVILDLLEVAPQIRQPAIREQVYRHARDHHQEL